MPRGRLGQRNSQGRPQSLWDSQGRPRSLRNSQGRPQGLWDRLV